jgi:membrane protein implicated in regulation of membrane protease activity
MEPNPPRPAFQLFVLFLIAVEFGALISDNYVLLVVVLAVICVVGYYWYRDGVRRRLKAKYKPDAAEPKEDWGGKRGDDGKPL